MSRVTLHGCNIWFCIWLETYQDGESYLMCLSSFTGRTEHQSINYPENVNFM